MNNTAILLCALCALAITNTVCFCLMKIDKARAQAGKWRIRESTLFLSAALFGALGGVLGMRLLRHKTKHWYFRWGFPALLAVQTALLAWGAWALLR